MWSEGGQDARSTSNSISAKVRCTPVLASYFREIITVIISRLFKAVLYLPIPHKGIGGN